MHEEKECSVRWPLSIVTIRASQAQGQRSGRSSMSSSGSAGEAGREVSVLHVQETHELWSRLAVNEEEGQVAVGHVDGKVSVYYYAPPA